mgnify:CR=1 FL=1
MVYKYHKDIRYVWQQEKNKYKVFGITYKTSIPLRCVADKYNIANRPCPYYVCPQVWRGLNNIKGYLIGIKTLSGILMYWGFNDKIWNLSVWKVGIYPTLKSKMIFWINCTKLFEYLKGGHYPELWL